MPTGSTDMDEERTERLRKWAEAGPTLIAEVVKERASLLNILARERDALAEELHQVQEENADFRERVLDLEQRHSAEIERLRVQKEDIARQLALAKVDAKLNQDKLSAESERRREEKCELDRRLKLAEKDSKLALSKLALENNKLRVEMDETVRRLRVLQEESELAEAKLVCTSKELRKTGSENKELIKDVAVCEKRIEALLAALQSSMHAEARAKSTAAESVQSLQKEIDKISHEAQDQRDRAEKERRRADDAEREKKTICARIQDLLPPQYRDREPAGSERSRISEGECPQEAGMKSVSKGDTKPEPQPFAVLKRNMAFKAAPAKRARRDRKKVSYSYPIRGDSDVVPD